LRLLGGEGAHDREEKANDKGRAFHRQTLLKNG
jgi:hypothetical protein